MTFDHCPNCGFPAEKAAENGNVWKCDLWSCTILTFRGEPYGHYEISDNRRLQTNQRP